MRLPLRPLLGLCAALLLSSASAQGQHRIERSAEPFLPCLLPVPDASESAGDHEPHRAALAPRVLERGSGQPAAQFEVTYEGFSAQAEAAFQAAVDVWAQHVTSAVPIRIRARWTDLGGNLLGSAGPYLTRGFEGAPVPGTWYPDPLADALAGRDLNPSRPDIEASFNSGFDRWYLGTDGNGPANQVELFTVVLHELGHGLGFIGSASVERGTGSFGLDQAPGVPFVFDRFAANATGCPLLNQAVYPSPSAALAQVLQDEVYFRGRAVVGTHGEPAPLYTPAVWNEGSSFSHFDESAFPPSVPDGLMTPLIAPGERKDSPGPLLCAALQDMGWTLAAACADLVADDPPPLTDGVCLPPAPTIDVYSLRPAGARGDEDTVVTRGVAVFELQVEVDQTVDVFLFDTRGRRVNTFSMGTVGAGGAEFITVEAGGLAGGLYLLRVVGEEFAATRKVVRLR